MLTYIIFWIKNNNLFYNFIYFKIILIIFLKINFIYKNNFHLLGIGDWGLGIGDWGLGIGPNPQSQIPKDRKSTRLNSSHSGESRMPSSA